MLEERRRAGAGRIRSGSDAAAKLSRAAVLLPARAAGSGDLSSVGEQSPQHPSGAVSVLSAGTSGQHVLHAAPAGPARRANPSRMPTTDRRLRIIPFRPTKSLRSGGRDAMGTMHQFEGFLASLLGMRSV